MNSTTLTQEELSQRWGVATRTLEQWRWNSRGPHYIKIGRRVSYPLKEIEAFEQKMLRRNTTEKPM